MFFRPVSQTTDGSTIIGITNPDGGGRILFSSESGDLYRMTTVPDSAFGNGEKNVFAQLLDGDGSFSDELSSNVFHELFRSVVDLSVGDKEFTIVADNIDAFSGGSSPKAFGVFTSDILKVDEDFGLWRTISWTQGLGPESRAVVAVKFGNTEEEVDSKEWFYLEEPFSQPYGYVQGETSVEFDLDRFNIKGRMMRFKVELTACVNDDIPVLSDLVISYIGKHSVFFFTTKFRLERNKGPEGVLLTASHSSPEFTEVIFGVTETNSATWSDYTVVDLDDLVELPSKFGDTVKVGIKMASQNQSEVPVVNEFAFLLDSKTDNTLNE